MFSPFLFETIAGSIVIIYLSETVIGPLSDITEIGKNTEDFRYVYIVRMYIFSPDGDLITLNIDQIAYIPTKEKKKGGQFCVPSAVAFVIMLRQHEVRNLSKDQNTIFPCFMKHNEQLSSFKFVKEACPTKKK